MKIRVTFDIDDTERIAISVLNTGEFKPAPRADLEAFIEEVVFNSLAKVRLRFDKAATLFRGEAAILNTEEANQ